MNVQSKLMCLESFPLLWKNKDSFIIAAKKWMLRLTDGDVKPGFNVVIKFLIISPVLFSFCRKTLIYNNL